MKVSRSLPCKQLQYWETCTWHKNLPCVFSMCSLLCILSLPWLSSSSRSLDYCVLSPCFSVHILLHFLFGLSHTLSCTLILCHSLPLSFFCPQLWHTEISDPLKTSHFVLSPNPTNNLLSPIKSFLFPIHTLRELLTLLLPTAPEGCVGKEGRDQPLWYGLFLGTSHFPPTGASQPIFLWQGHKAGWQ